MTTPSIRRPIAAVLLGKWLARVLQRRATTDADFLARIEQWLRNPDANHTDPSTLELAHWEFMARAVQRWSREEFRALLEHVHKKSVRGASSAVWRSYRYKGYQVTHDVRHKAQWNAYIQGRHQPGVGYWLSHYAKSSRAALDVGANVGIFSLEMATALPRGGKVFAFEPNPTAAAVLERTVTDNQLDCKIDLVPHALGADTAVLPLHVPNKNAGAASLSTAKGDGEQVDVRVLSFTDWWATAGEPAIDLIKIDVEGHEEAVLKGMWPYLRQATPVLVMEVTFSRLSNKSNLISDLTKLGYAVRRIIHRPPYIEDLSHPVGDQADLLCEPRTPL